MNRPREATQEFLIRVREGMTKKVYEVGAHSQDEEATLDGREDKSARYPMEPVPIKAWTEGPCKWDLLDGGGYEALDADRYAPTDGHEKYLGEDFNTLLLVAGGSGVSYTLSTSMDLVRRARAMYVGSDCKTIAVATKRLSFVWMVKTPGESGQTLPRRVIVLTSRGSPVNSTRTNGMDRRSLERDVSHGTSRLPEHYHIRHFEAKERRTSRDGRLRD